MKSSRLFGPSERRNVRRSLYRRQLHEDSEATKLLGCTRQYVNQLVNQNKIKPIKVGSNNNLFMRGDIEEDMIFDLHKKSGRCTPRPYCGI